MKSYSQDLRERIVKRRQLGDSAAEIAKLMDVSKRSVERYCAQQRSTGSIRPKQRGGYRRSRLADHDALLCQWIKEDTSITLEEMLARLRQEADVSIGKTALWFRLEKLGLSFKKNAARRRARSARR